MNESEQRLTCLTEGSGPRGPRFKSGRPDQIFSSLQSIRRLAKKRRLGRGSPGVHLLGGGRIIARARVPAWLLTSRHRQERDSGGPQEPAREGAGVTSAPIGTTEPATSEMHADYAARADASTVATFTVPPGMITPYVTANWWRSLSIPAAVTSGPAPGPVMTRGSLR